jgi:hypothetical protein
MQCAVRAGKNVEDSRREWDEKEAKLALQNTQHAAIIKIQESKTKLLLLERESERKKQEASQLLALLNTEVKIKEKERAAESEQLLKLEEQLRNDNEVVINIGKFDGARQTLPDALIDPVLRLRRNSVDLLEQFSSNTDTKSTSPNSNLTNTSRPTGQTQHVKISRSGRRKSIQIITDEEIPADMTVQEFRRTRRKSIVDQIGDAASGILGSVLVSPEMHAKQVVSEIAMTILAPGDKAENQHEDDNNCDENQCEDDNHYNELSGTDLEAGTSRSVVNVTDEDPTETKVKSRPSRLHRMTSMITINIDSKPEEVVKILARVIWMMYALLPIFSLHSLKTQWESVNDVYDMAEKVGNVNALFKDHYDWVHWWAMILNGCGAVFILINNLYFGTKHHRTHKSCSSVANVMSKLSHTVLQGTTVMELKLIISVIPKIKCGEDCPINVMRSLGYNIIAINILTIVLGLVLWRLVRWLKKYYGADQSLADTLKRKK